MLPLRGKRGHLCRVCLHVFLIFRLRIPLCILRRLCRFHDGIHIFQQSDKIVLTIGVRGSVHLLFCFKNVPQLVVQFLRQTLHLIGGQPFVEQIFLFCGHAVDGCRNFTPNIQDVRAAQPEIFHRLRRAVRQLCKYVQRGRLTGVLNQRVHGRTDVFAASARGF